MGLTGELFAPALENDVHLQSQRPMDDTAEYIPGITGFANLIPYRTDKFSVYVKAQPVENAQDGVFSCPHDDCDYTWYDARYEVDQTVTVWVVSTGAPGEAVSRLYGKTEVTLEGAVDIFTQATATIALCILSLNLF